MPLSIWKIAQIYSNADGSVQFIMLTNGSNYEELLAGHTLTGSGAFGTVNLPSAGTTNLLGHTIQVQVPGDVQPDYIFTNSGPFLSPSSGTINYADVDIVSYIRLPSDGVHALIRPMNGGTNFSSPASNAPCNFQGQCNCLVPALLSSIQHSGDAVTLSFLTASGTNQTARPSFAVEYNQTIGAVDWLTLTNISGSSTITLQTVMDVTSAASHRLYRLRVH